MPSPQIKFDETSDDHLYTHKKLGLIFGYLNRVPILNYENNLSSRTVNRWHDRQTSSWITKNTTEFKQTTRRFTSATIYSNMPFQMVDHFASRCLANFLTETLNSNSVNNYLNLRSWIPKQSVKKHTRDRKITIWSDFWLITWLVISSWWKSSKCPLLNSL